MFRSSSLSIISVCSRDSVQGNRGLRVLDCHQVKHVINTDFGRLPSGGYHHIVSSSGSGGGFCRKTDEEETGTVLDNTDCRHQHWSGENRRIFDFQVEHLTRASVVNKNITSAVPWIGTVNSCLAYRTRIRAWLGWTMLWELRSKSKLFLVFPLSFSLEREPREWGKKPRNEHRFYQLDWQKLYSELSHLCSDQNVKV